MIEISALASADDTARRDLIALLQDAVYAGASIGFLSPLSVSDAAHYWDSVFADVAQGSRMVLVAREQDGIIGSVQMDLCMRPNGHHRAEVQKLFVHTAWRRRGIARQLMVAIEKAAGKHGRTLLCLDTQPDQPAERMYRELGWQEVGQIPDYARSPDGELHGTVLFFKKLRLNWNR